MRVLWPSPFCCLGRGRELPRSPSKGVVELDVPWSGSFPPPALTLVLSLRPWMQDALRLTCLAPWVRAWAMLAGAKGGRTNDAPNEESHHKPHCLRAPGCSESHTVGLRVLQHSLPLPPSPPVSHPISPGRQIPLKDCSEALQPVLPTLVGRETLAGQCLRPEIPRRLCSPGWAGRAGRRLGFVPCGLLLAVGGPSASGRSGFPQQHGEALLQTR